MTAPTWATAVAHGAIATHAVSAQPMISGRVAKLQLHEQSRLRAAAEHSRRVYPGALGELVARELSWYVEFGCRLAEDGLGARLATQVLAFPAASKEHLRS
ncbi:hypothetical protein GCM10023203_13860 [Actinomycetospora straminea]|uniref:Uncharacterized protein n=1 Tax=Actinomycetospora straminea TaxID=663607 RepID=A0ABP9E2Z3_9PSEU